MVEIEVPGGRAVLSGLLLLVVPLLLFLPFYHLPRLFGLQAGEGLRVLCGLLGVAAGFLVNLIGPLRKKAQARPEIVRRVE